MCKTHIWAIKQRSISICHCRWAVDRFSQFVLVVMVTGAAVMVSLAVSLTR